MRARTAPYRRTFEEYKSGNEIAIGSRSSFFFRSPYAVALTGSRRRRTRKPYPYISRTTRAEGVRVKCDIRPLRDAAEKTDEIRQTADEEAYTAREESAPLPTPHSDPQQRQIDVIGFCLYNYM
jgi:hypothetical protein